MEVHYCDLCSNPMKDGQSWILYTASPQALKETLSTQEEVLNYVSRVNSEQKEICPACKHLFDRIFFHRLEGMATLTEECVELFNLPPYEKKAIGHVDNPGQLGIPGPIGKPKKKKGKK